MREGMNPGKYGYDYTPLHRFLHSKVGQPWAPIYAEAQARLKGQDYGEDPIWWSVAKNPSEISSWGYLRIGENSMWSQLFIDDNGILQIADPEAKGKISCSCCTDTFNGKVLDPHVKENWYNPDSWEVDWVKDKNKRQRENRKNKKAQAEKEYNFTPKEDGNNI